METSVAFEALPAHTVLLEGLDCAKGLRGLLAEIRIVPTSAHPKDATPATSLALSAISLGRDDEHADVPLPLCAGISKAHLCLALAQIDELGAAGLEQLCVRDLGSKNGTFVNGCRIPSGGSSVLCTGDIISLASAEVVSSTLLADAASACGSGYLPQVVPAASFRLRYIGITSGSAAFAAIPPDHPVFVAGTTGGAEQDDPPPFADALPPHVVDQVLSRRAARSGSSLMREDEAIEVLEQMGERGHTFFELHSKNACSALTHIAELVAAAAGSKGASKTPSGTSSSSASSSSSSSSSSSASTAAAKGRGKGRKAKGAASPAASPHAATLDALKAMELQSKQFLCTPEAVSRGVYVGDVADTARLVALRSFGVLSRRCQPRVSLVADSLEVFGPAMASLRYPVSLQALGLRAETASKRGGTAGTLHAVASAFEATNVSGHAQRMCLAPAQGLARHPLPTRQAVAAARPPRPAEGARYRVVRPGDFARAASPSDGPELVSNVVLPSYYAPTSPFSGPVRATAFFGVAEDPFAGPRPKDFVAATGDYACFVSGDNVVTGKVLARRERDTAVVAQSRALAMRWWRAHKRSRLDAELAGKSKSDSKALREALAKEHWLSVRQFLLETMPRAEDCTLLVAQRPEQQAGTRKSAMKQAIARAFASLCPKALPAGLMSDDLRRALEPLTDFGREALSVAKRVTLVSYGGLVSIARRVFLSELSRFWEATVEPDARPLPPPPSSIPSPAAASRVGRTLSADSASADGPQTPTVSSSSSSSSASAAASSATPAAGADASDDDEVAEPEAGAAIAAGAAAEAGGAAAAAAGKAKARAGHCWWAADATPGSVSPMPSAAHVAAQMHAMVSPGGPGQIGSKPGWTLADPNEVVPVRCGLPSWTAIARSQGSLRIFGGGGSVSPFGVRVRTRPYAPDAENPHLHSHEASLPETPAAESLPDLEVAPGATLAAHAPGAAAAVAESASSVAPGGEAAGDADEAEAKPAGGRRGKRARPASAAAAGPLAKAARNGSVVAATDAAGEASARREPASGAGSATDDSLVREWLGQLVAIAPLNDYADADISKVLLVPASALRPGPIAIAASDVLSEVSSATELAISLFEPARAALSGAESVQVGSHPLMSSSESTFGYQRTNDSPLTVALARNASQLRRVTIGALLDLTGNDPTDFAALPLPFKRSAWTLLLCHVRDKNALRRGRRQARGSSSSSSSSSSASSSAAAAASTAAAADPQPGRVPTGLGALPARILRTIIHMIAPRELHEGCLALDSYVPHVAALAVSAVSQWDKADVGRLNRKASSASGSTALLRRSAVRLGVHGLPADRLRSPTVPKHLQPGVPCPMVIRASLVVDPRLFANMAQVAEAEGLPGDTPIDGGANDGDVGLDAAQTVEKTGSALNRKLSKTCRTVGMSPASFLSARRSLPEFAFAEAPQGGTHGELTRLALLVSSVALSAARGSGSETLGTGLTTLPEVAASARIVLPRQVALQFGPSTGPWRRDATATLTYAAGAGADSAVTRAAEAAANATKVRHRAESFASQDKDEASPAAEDDEGDDDKAQPSSKGAAAASTGGRLTKREATSDDSEESAVSTGDPFDLFHILEACRPPAKAPNRPTPKGMGETQLLPYQRRALAWMHAVEDGEFAERSGLQPDPSFDALQLPLWDEDDYASPSKAATLFVFSMVPRQHFGRGRFGYGGRVSATPLILLRPPLARGPPTGGILADEMGLGKTLEVAALVLARRRPVGTFASESEDFPLGQRSVVRRVLAGRPEAEALVVDIAAEAAGLLNDGEGEGEGEGEGDAAATAATAAAAAAAAAAAPTRRSRRSRMATGTEAAMLHRLKDLGLSPEHARQIMQGQVVHADSAITPIKATLVVAPTPLISQWAAELLQHAPGLRVVRYDGLTQGLGSRSAFSASASEDFMDADVVLCSYDALRHDKRKHKTKTLSPLLMVEWWRVILDEAQMVSTSTSETSRMAADLGRVHAWCVSGTPMSSRVSDLHGLLTFLAFVPFARQSLLQATILDPFLQRQPVGLSRMRGIMQSIMWRHRKDHVASEIHLPALTVEDVWVELSDIERSIYAKAHEDIRRIVARIFDEASKGVGGVWALASTDTADAEEPVEVPDDSELVVLPRRGPRRVNRGAANARLRAQRVAKARVAAAAKTSKGAGAVPPALSADLMRLRQTCCHPRVVASGKRGGIGVGRGSMREIFRVMVQQALDERANRSRDEARARLALAMAGVTGMALTPPGTVSAAAAKLVTSERKERELKEVASLLQQGRAADAEQPEGSVEAAPAAARAEVVPIHLLVREGEDPSAEADIASALAVAVASAAAGKPLDAKATLATKLMPSSPPQWRLEAPAAHAAARWEELYKAMDQDVNLRSWARVELRLLDVAIALRRDGLGSGLATGGAWTALHAGSMAASSSSASSASSAGAGAFQRVSQSDATMAFVPRVPQFAVWSAVLVPVTGLELASGPVVSLLARRAALATLLGEDSFSKVDRTTSREKHSRDAREAAADRRDAAAVAKAEAEAERAAREAEMAAVRAANAHALGMRARDEHSEAARRELESLDSSVHAASSAKDLADGDVARMRKQLLASPDAGPSSAVEQLSDCPVCHEPIDRPALTPCGHVMCDECAGGLVASAEQAGRRPTCPHAACCAPFDPSDLVMANARDSGEQAAAARASPLRASASSVGGAKLSRAASVADGDIDPVVKESLSAEAAALVAASADMDDLRDRFGSKVAELVRRLGAIRSKECAAKVVVFSQWVKLLELVGEALSECGVTYRRLSAAAKSDAVMLFRTDPRVTVLLVSTKQGGGAAGLTLTMAHHLFLMEPSTNVGLEDQAMARVHRIGQKRPVTVHRLLAADTVEAGILDVQAMRKRAAASKSGSAGKESESLSLFDVCRIFQLLDDGLAA